MLVFSSDIKFHIHFCCTYIVNGVEDLKVVRCKGLRHAVERRLRRAGDAVRVGGTLVGAVEGLGNLPVGRYFSLLALVRAKPI